jgi:hypothetical protein
MKIGSLYFSSTALGRYIGLNARGEHCFERLMIDERTGTIQPINDTAMYNDLSIYGIRMWTHRSSVANRRQYQNGDNVFYLRNGGYTVYPREGIITNITLSNATISRAPFIWTRRQIDITVHECIRPATFQECDANCRRAVLYWLMAAQRTHGGGVCKDIRTLIAKYVWDTREDRTWENRRRGPARAAKKPKKHK